MIGEALTHFDAQTDQNEMATQWTSLAIRFAKTGVDMYSLICHSGKDLHPEATRLVTLPYFQREKVVDLSYPWPVDTDMTTDQILAVLSRS